MSGQCLLIWDKSSEWLPGICSPFCQSVDTLVKDSNSIALKRTAVKVWEHPDLRQIIPQSVISGWEISVNLCLNHLFHHPEHSGMYQRSNTFHYWNLIHQTYPLEPHDRADKCLEARTIKDQTFPQLNFNLQHLVGNGKRWGSLQPWVAGGCTTGALPSP